MTRAEQEAFDKWMKEQWGDRYKDVLNPVNFYHSQLDFLAGYRAGFEAQHYDIEDASKGKVE